jgi:chitin disaccharide deacetylase
VRAELDAQIRLARSRGLVVSHLDSHQHVHALPGIARVVADLAKAHGIRAVRYPLERPRAYMFGALRNARRLGEHLALNAVCLLSPLQRARHVERFVGFHFGGRLTEKNLERVLRHLPARATVELMCHPAEAEPEGPQAKWGYAGPAEREALTSARIKALIGERGIRLIGYRDL